MGEGRRVKRLAEQAAYIGTLEPEQFSSIAALYELVTAAKNGPVSVEKWHDQEGLLT